MTTTAPKTPRLVASSLPVEVPTPKVDVPADLRAYIDYRYAQLENRRQEIQLRNTSGISTGALMRHDQDAGIIRIFLEEIKSLSAWLEAGKPMYIPPLSDDEKLQWRFARDHGGAVPEHILSQL